MSEKLSIRERVTDIAGAGLLALALVSCAPPSQEYDAYYNPFTDQITYLDGAENNEAIVRHEEYHKEDANSYEWGRIGWGIRYNLDADFRCLQEQEANEAGEMYPIYNHSACDILK